MCLPFLCGGHDRDHGETPAHPGIQQHPHQPPLSHPPPPLSPPPPRYVTTPPLKESYDNGDGRPPAGTVVAGGEAKNRAADAAPWHVADNKNGEHVRAFHTTDAAGVQRAPAAGVHGSYLKEPLADKMRAPPAEAHMARRGGAAEGDPPTVAATTPSPAASNFYDGRSSEGDYAYGRDNRKPQGNSWW